MQKIELDYFFVLATLALSLIGLVFVYSATHLVPADGGMSHSERQLVWLVLGILLAGILYFVPLRVHEAMAYVYYGVALVMLAAVLAVSKEGAARWFRFAGLGIQPVEFAKLALCMALARFLAYRRARLHRFTTIFGGIFMVMIPTVLVIKQPDLGSSLVGLAMFIGMLFWAGMPVSRILMVISPVLSLVTAFHWLSWAMFFLAFLVLVYFARLRLLPAALFLLINLTVGMTTPLLWNRFHEYQRQRILTFLDPGQDPAGAGYQIIQSKIAIGSGGFLGKGFMQSTQTKLNYLPAQHTDFIFSVIAEETGFIGGMVVVVLFGVLVFRGFMTAYKARNTFYSNVAAGLTAAIFFQMVVNIGMTIGLMPVTGLPLPFVSYGGSAMLFFWAVVGILSAINRDWQEY